MPVLQTSRFSSPALLVSWVALYYDGRMLSVASRATGGNNNMCVVTQ